MLDRSVAPSLNGFDDLRFDYPQYTTLKNGVKLYVVNNGDQEVNKFEVIYRGGLLEEQKPLQSFALASMLIHGSKDYSSNDVAEFLDYNGAYLSATNADNFTHISLNALNVNFKDVLPLLKSVLESPSLPEREFDVLKTQVKGAYQTARQKVKYLAQTAGRKLYFGENHPIACVITDEMVDALTREDVFSFHEKYYRPENMELVLSGKVGDAEIALIDQIFGMEKVSGEPAEIVNIPRNPSNDRSVIVNKDGALQSAVYLIQEAVPRNHPDYVNLRILITALGGYFGSRLMQNVREDKGYTYGINSMLMGRRSGSKVVIMSECDTAYTKPLIDEVRNEIVRLQKELMCEEELDIVKNCMLSDLAKTLDSPFSMASCVSSNLIYATGEDYFNRQVRDILAVTPEVLCDVANKYLDAEKLYVSVAGDEKQLKIS